MLSPLSLLIFCACLHGTISIEFSSLDHIKPSTSPSVQESTVKELIRRVIGDRSSDFNVTVDPHIGPPNKHTVKLVWHDGKVDIVGTTGVAVAWGFYHYLSQYCKAHVSWAGHQVKLPAVLPDLPQHQLIISSNERFHYYQNVCTTSYSFVWWDWKRWEREIDWMAMNGINLALSFNAEEAIWQRVYLKMGLNSSDLINHFSGPAFFAWFRMGNMHGFGGPLPQSWHTQQLALQHQILDRMRGLGMTPALPAFAGHVPNAITKIFPSAKVSHLPNWGNFNDTYCCTMLLDLQDPLFPVIGKLFIEEYVKEFGTDHIYNTDTFNEMTPASSDPEYLRAAGKAVYDALIAGDSQAIWLMQGWLFCDQWWTSERAKALLTSVPIGRMMVLDLFSEVWPQYPRLESYYGQPYIWCMLHNYGGTLSMYGVIDVVNKRPSEARRIAGSTMVGLGITPEGIHQNNVMYEFMLENSWRTEPRNTTQWITDYALRRYGATSDSINSAWMILKDGVYNCKKQIKYHGKTIFIRRPKKKYQKLDEEGVYNCHTEYNDHGFEALVIRPGIDRGLPEMWYSVDEFYKAWDLFITASAELKDSNLFRYDLVDVSRQSLQIIFEFLYHRVIKSYKDSAKDDFNKYSDQLLMLMVDLDTLLGSDDHFLLGHWLEDAKGWGLSADEKRLYEYNARNQLTLWGPDANILDYANKQWSGLVKSYYYPRWHLFIDELKSHWNGTFVQKDFDAKVFTQVEEPFTFHSELYPIKPIGDQIQEARNVHTKYRPMAQRSVNYFNKRMRALKSKQAQLTPVSPSHLRI